MSATHNNLVTDDSKARAAFTMVALLAEAQGSSAKSLAAVRIESPEKCWPANTMVNIGKARNPVNQSVSQLVVTSIKGEAVQDPNIVA